MVKSKAVVEIVEYRPDLAEAFERLNMEWIERWFRLESIDAAVLSDPEGAILAGGGTILFALVDGVTVGTCALKRDGDRYELTKMAVTPAAQGAGVGRALVQAIIQRFKALGGSELWLETAYVLEPAIQLYKSSGFVPAEAPRPSEDRRCELYMVYRSG